MPYIASIYRFIKTTYGMVVEGAGIDMGIQ
jgi:hypothetical protein